MKDILMKIKKRYLRFRYCKKDCSNCKYAYTDINYQCCELDD